MALFIVLGVMNVAAMVVLTVVVLAEKLWVHGEAVARTAGIVALGLAVLVIWFPWLVPGLLAGAEMSDMTGS